MSVATKTDRFKMERLNEKITELTATAEQRLEMICTLHDDIAEMHGELDKAADKLNRVIAVAEWRYGKNRRQEYQLAMLRKERERLQATLRRAGLSIMAHPGYTGEPNEEWTDLIESIEELVNILP